MSWPKSSATTIRAIDTKNTKSATRRTCRGERKEAATRTATAGIRKRTWRCTKWNVERPSRSATGGLPAIVNTSPDTISGATAARIQRSIVHHQFASAERSARDTIVSPFSPVFSRRAKPRQARENDRRASQNPEIDRTTRKPAKEERLVPRAGSQVHRAQLPEPLLRAYRSSHRERNPQSFARNSRSPRRSDKP